MTFRVDSYNMTLAIVDHDLIILINACDTSNALYTRLTFIKLYNYVIYIFYLNYYEVKLSRIFLNYTLLIRFYLYYIIKLSNLYIFLLISL